MSAEAASDMERLGDLDLFRDLDASARGRLERALTHVELAPGEVLMRQGEKADSLYVVLRGRLSVSLASEAEGPQTVSEIGPGGVAGEIALLTGGLRSATVSAAEPSALVRLSREAMEEWVAQHPEALGPLVAGIRRRLDLMQLALHLGRLLGVVHPDVLREFWDEVEWLHLRGGETLFEQGASGDSAYILISGRLRITVRNDGEEKVVNELGRGEIVGEMALLDGSPRTATVHAVRDSRLARLSELAFSRLTEKYPLALKKIASSVVSRLRVQLAGGATLDSDITTIAAVAASRDVPLSRLSADLAAALSAHGSTRHLSADGIDRELEKTGMSSAPSDDPSGIRLAQWLDEQEAAHRYVLYEADLRQTGWTERAIGNADHVLIFADADAPPVPGVLERQLAQRWPEGRAPRRSLVLVHRDPYSEPSDTARWLQPRSVDAHYHLHPRVRADNERLARVLAGRSVGLVLGGGGARGFAHLGVWRALEEVGVPIDFVAGTSIGAIAAGALATGVSADQALELAKTHFGSVLDPTLPLVSLLAGKRIRANIAGFFAEREIEDLRLPYFCISTNLSTSAETVHRTGSLAEAIRSSISIPGVLPPVSSGGHLLVDGGLLNNVPVDVMRRLGHRGPVIAVDVTPEVDLGEFHGLPDVLSGWEVLREWLNPLRATPELPYIVNVLTRSTVVASAAGRKEQPSEDAQLYLRPSVADWGLFDFGAVEAIAQRAYEVTIDPIREWWAQRPLED